MNELETALLIRRALDKGAERLPYKTTHRLEKARFAALARMEQPLAQTGLVQSLQNAGGSLALGQLGSGEGRFGWLSSFAFAALPILFVVAGMFGVSHWTDHQRADEVAEVDAAMLTDDLPISLYADRGFGVFIKNSNQPIK